MPERERTVKEIEARLAQSDVAPAEIAALARDGRASVRRLVARWEKAQAERARVRALYGQEEAFYARGLSLVAGVDEAGRGPLAGPVVVAAVILPPHFFLPKINDSKKLSPSAREALYAEILASAVAVGRAVVSERTIDEINIYRAAERGMYEAVAALRPQPQAVLTDALPLSLPVPSVSLIKGDAISASIAAASIVAKVERDRMMRALDARYPQYGFARHKGYGTAEHLAALRQFGPCEIHRRTFEPIKSLEAGACQ